MEVTTTMLLAAFGASAITVILIWMLVSRWLARRRTVVDQRIRPTEESDPTILLDEVLVTQGGGWWQQTARTLRERLERTELRLEPMEALAIILFCGVVLSAIVFFWRYEAEEVWMAFPAFFLGAGVPLAYFAFRQRVWRLRMQDQLPDMLFLMARSLRAGLSIDQSIQVVGEHGVAPLSREFARMHRQLELGLALPQVLQSTARHVRLVDFSVFASVLSLHRATGGSLPVIMDRLAQTTRDHNHLRGYYRTATALGRFGNIIIAIMSVVVVAYFLFAHRELAAHYFASPEGFALFATGIGLMVAAVALFFYFLRAQDL